MTLGYTGLRVFEIGKETVLGTAVACTTIMRMEGKIKDEAVHSYPKEDVGYIRGVGRAFIPKNDGTIPIDTPATFEQLVYFLNMGLKGVTGVQDGAGSGYVYTYPFPTNTVLTPFTYTGRLGDNNQAELITALFAEELTLKGEAEKEITVSGTLRGWPGGTTTFTGGLSIPTVEECLFGPTKLFIDAPGGTIGTTQVTDGFRSFELKLSKIFQARWLGGSAVTYTRLVMNSACEITLTIKLDHDATSLTERAARRARTHRQVRVECLGSALGTPGTHSTKKVRIDVIGSYKEPEPYDDDNGVTSLQFNMMGHYSATPALGGQIVVVNELSALP